MTTYIAILRGINVGGKRMINEAIYLYCPNGYSNSKLTNAFFESKLKVTATTRNWRTVLELWRLGEEAAKRDL